MITIILLILFGLGFGTMWAQQKFKIFNTEISAKDITGSKSFNDLGVYFNTDIINNLTDDISTFLWRLGSIRLDANNFKKGFAVR